MLFRMKNLIQVRGGWNSVVLPFTLKSFFVSSYPDAEWNCLGQFEASNERKVHSFPLATEENVYAKFIKVL